MPFGLKVARQHKYRPRWRISRQLATGRIFTQTGFVLYYRPYDADDAQLLSAARYLHAFASFPWPGRLRTAMPPTLVGRHACGNAEFDGMGQPTAYAARAVARGGRLTATLPLAIRKSP